MISIILISILLFLGIYALVEIISDNLNLYYYYSSQGLIMEIINQIQEDRPDPLARLFRIIFNALRVWFSGTTEDNLDTTAYLEQIERDIDLDMETISRLEQCESDEEILEQLYSD